MPKFSKRSNDRLDSCRKDLQDLFRAVVEEYDCAVIQGHRGEEEQDSYYHSGKSRVQWPSSKHNASPSKAADVAPYPIDWSNTKRFYHFAGYVKGVADRMGIKIRWGGDWDSDNDLDDQTFMDLVHFEVVD